jgi:probable rRNA maturation factor
MTLMVDVAMDRVRVPLARARVRALATFVLERERVRDAMVSIAFVTRTAIARLNERHLGHKGATDVISFALGSAAGAPARIGDIYIAPAVAQEHARERRIPTREEIARLVVHGVLHVLGHDHPEGDDRERSPMWRRQERLLSAAREAGRW